jgi:hypothetical protein
MFGVFKIPTNIKAETPFSDELSKLPNSALHFKSTGFPFESFQTRNKYKLQPSLEGYYALTSNSGYYIILQPKSVEANRYVHTSYYNSHIHFKPRIIFSRLL